MSASSPKRGRPRTVSPEAVAATGLRLFSLNGFTETTMSDVAVAAGIGRKTLFTYFPTKADIVWSRFESELEDLRTALKDVPAEIPTARGIRVAMLKSFRRAPDQLAILREEVELIDSVPALQGYVYLRGQQWADVVAEFVTGREGGAARDILPQMLGRGVWSTMLLAYRKWIETEEESPVRFLEQAFNIYEQAFTAVLETDTQKESHQ